MGKLLIVVSYLEADGVGRFFAGLGGEKGLYGGGCLVLNGFSG